GNARAIGCVAGSAADGAELSRCELIINRSGIALRPASLLIDEGLDAGHDRRSEGGATRTGPGARITAADRSAMRRVRPAEDVVVAPEPVRRKQRNVGRVANAVVGIAENRLPGRLWPTRAGTADHTIDRRRACGALTRTTTARRSAFEQRAQEGIVAQAGGAGGRVAEVRCNQPAGARVVPRNFGNIG